MYHHQGRGRAARREHPILLREAQVTLHAGLVFARAYLAADGRPLPLRPVAGE